MAGNNPTLKTKLYILTGSIVLLCLLFFILQYNNFFYSKKYTGFSTISSKVILYPGEIQNLHQHFINNDLLDEQYYLTGKSSYTDSIFSLLDAYNQQLNTLANESYLPVSSSLKNQIRNIVQSSLNLKDSYNGFKKVALERGLYSSGISGEWYRFGNYLQDLAVIFNNSSVLQAVANINKLKGEYEFSKSGEKLTNILDQVSVLKSELISNNIKGIVETDRQKFIKELDNFVLLTQKLQKFDIEAGFSGGSGKLGELTTSINVLQSKSDKLNDELQQKINNSISDSFYIKSAFIILLIAIYLFILHQFSNHLLSSIETIKTFAVELMQGKIPSITMNNSNAECKDISDLLNNYMGSLREKIKFASSLGTENAVQTIVPLSEEDTLANALLDLEKSIAKAEEEDKKYKIDEQKRAWTNEGLAKFGEILRMQTDNLSTLSDEIITNLVQYLNANQGGIFLYNDDNPADIHLELLSTFAYNRKKYTKKRIEIGEGLVGTCAQEKQTIFVTEIPEEYIEITSGLGNASPRCLLIVPLKTESTIFGIVEIASFNKLLQHEVDFVEKIAQSIASTFATVKININTAKLLLQSKKQAEEMAQQEEELRQNLEELQATQEESARREAEISSLIQAVDLSSLVLQTDMEGRITEVNKKFSSVINLHRDELIGRYIKTIFQFNAESEEYYQLLHSLKQGQTISRNEKIRVDEEQFAYIEIHYSPIVGIDGKPYKILAIANNQTEIKNLEKVVHEKSEAIRNLEYQFNEFTSLINEGFIQVELSPDGTILNANENYLETSGYDIKEIKGKSYKKFLKPDELKQFEMVWPEVTKNKVYKGVFKRTKPTGDEYFLMSTFIPYANIKGLLEKVFLIAQDITEKKLKYQVLEDANKEIERLRGLSEKPGNA